MTRWRRFERQGTALEYWEIRQEGIRCFLRWGSDRTPGKASTTILDDEEQARATQHAARRINDRLRKGFTEVEPPCDPAEAEAGTPVRDLITRSAHGRPADGIAAELAGGAVLPRRNHAPPTRHDHVLR